jgi:RimJ/RimL family protein N-acetyltransferase
LRGACHRATLRADPLAPSGLRGSLTWGQGLASEVATALTDIGLSQLELPSLIGLVFVGNGASRRVLEKSNYLLEKSTTHRGEDVVIYRIQR